MSRSSVGQPESLAAWGAWSANLEGQLTDHGLPTRGSTTVGVCGTGTKLAGYSLVEPDDLDAAAIAKTCPALADGDAVQIAAAVGLPAGTE